MDRSLTSNLPTEMLQYIMELLPLRDVLSCREVNHKWKSAATLPARKKCAPIPFSGKINIFQRSKIVSKFNDCVRETGGAFPVSTVHITWNSVDRWMDWNGCPCVPEFFELVSPFISELSLDFRLGAAPVPMDKMNIKQHEYPKLKVLSLEVLSDYSDAATDETMPFGNDNSLFTFLKGIIENAPSLDSVTFTVGQDIQATNTIRTCLTEIGIRENPKLLTSLTILCSFNKVDWQSLTVMGLELKTFSITFRDSAVGVDSTVMKAFLGSQANTLTSLEIDSDIYKVSRSVSIDVPILPQLKHLKIGRDTGMSESGLRFPSLSYQVQFPTLKEINLMNAGGSQPDLFASHLAPLDTVEKLILPRMWDKRNQMFEIARLFPNVKKLQLNHGSIDESHVEVIQYSMRGIEELWLVNIGECADFIITGLNKRECEQIKYPPSESFNRAVEKLQLRRNAINIGCLENLKALRIHNDLKDRRCYVELNEISAYVLKKMKNLNRLDFGVRKFPPFVSKALLDDLEKYGIQVTSQCPPYKRAVLGLLPRNDDKVLEQFFYYLRLRDLLNCRLVHPSWRKNATKLCRDKTNEIQFAYQGDVNRAILMREFLCLLNKSTDLQSFPTGKFRVRIGPLDKNNPRLRFKQLSPNEIARFFNTIALFATEVTVVVSLGNETDRSYKFLPEDVKFLKLKSLTLCVRNDDTHSADASNSNASKNEKCSLLKFLRGVVENAEALTQIALKIGDQWKTPTTAIQMCVEEGGIQTKINLLTHLKIKAPVAIVNWVTLGSIGLKLESLSITSRETAEWQDETFKGFLQSQADTLTALEIKHVTIYHFQTNQLTKCSISFPSMTRLKSLEISSIINPGGILDWRNFEILDLSYIRQFPALKQLNLKEGDTIWPSFLRDDVLPLDTLEELILPEHCYDENSIIKAALLFPNIKKLHVAAKQNMLNAVYEGMQNLEGLTLYTTLGTSIDGIISGLLPGQIPNVVGPRVAKVKAWRKLLMESNIKSMNRLEDLKILRLKTDRSVYGGRILEFSDVTAFVLREMKSLKCLDLGVRNLSILRNESDLLDELKQTLSVLITEQDGKVLRKRRTRW